MHKHMLNPNFKLFEFLQKAVEIKQHLSTMIKKNNNDKFDTTTY